MTVTRSYIAGAWSSLHGEVVAITDATTSETIAKVSRDAVDYGSAFSYGRSVGGPALAELTFHQRADILKALARSLNAQKQVLYALSSHSGATNLDAAADVDGGIGALFSYAALGRSELPDSRWLLDGSTEVLSKQGNFVGQHLYSSMPGLAVQVNAFNFPVWGMLEKFAPAFLAGAPTLAKPATQTAYIAFECARQMIDSGHLPPGALQFACSPPDGLLNELGPQDFLSFTGSAATARLLRAHSNVVDNSVRFNAEADSLNCSILGPDATPDSEEFVLFVNEVAREITAKTGQKCTAIRRALVPSALIGAVTDALASRLARTIIGDPRLPEVRMGPLVSMKQRDDVRTAAVALSQAGRIAWGSLTHVEPVGADPTAGAFISPILIQVNDPARAEPHEIEAFGPVCSLIAYRDTADAIHLAARGAGSLVASIVTSDQSFGRLVVQGLAPWHGRILILDPRAAPESTGHGSPLPQLVHGGPGRAGGGEELGGLRAVRRHMQRTAVQASPDMLTAVLHPNGQAQS